MIAYALKTAINFIPKPVYAGILLTVILLFGFQSCSVEKLKKENARYEAAVEQCVKTNQSNKRSIEFFKLQNDQCLDDRRADEIKLANAVAAWNAEKALLTEKAAEVEIQNIEVYRTPSCAELAQVNVTDICPAFVERVRRRAESYNGIRNGND